MNSKLARQLAIDEMCFGVSAYTKTQRHKWNPLRFIFGEYKYKRILPKNLYTKMRSQGPTYICPSVESTLDLLKERILK